MILWQCFTFLHFFDKFDILYYFDIFWIIFDKFWQFLPFGISFDNFLLFGQFRILIIILIIFEKKNKTMTATKAILDNSRDLWHLRHLKDLNSWQFLWPDNKEWHWTAILALFRIEVFQLKDGAQQAVTSSRKLYLCLMGQ